MDLDRRKPVSGKKWDQFTMMDEARRMMSEYPDLRVSVQIPAAISSGTANADVEFTLVGPDLEKLTGYSADIIRQLRTRIVMGEVQTGAGQLGQALFEQKQGGCFHSLTPVSSATTAIPGTRARSVPRRWPRSSSTRGPATCASWKT